MSKTKESETQPYRNFKEFLDTIIKMPENLKNRLANEFERRRLEVPVVEAPIVEAPVVEAPVVEAPVVEDKSEKKSFFGDMFSKNSSEDNPVVTEDNPVVTEDNPVVTEDNPVVTEDKDKSLFDSIFSKKQSDEMINNFSGTEPPKKCQIRPW
jgi:hypothetical protein